MLSAARRAIPIIVGGSGERRTLKIVAEQADGCNLPSDEHVLSAKIDTLRRHCTAIGRDPTEVEITVLDLPVIGTDREDVGLRVETSWSHTGRRVRSSAPCGHAREPRPALSPARGSRVGTVFCSLADLTRADDLAHCAPLLQG